MALPFLQSGGGGSGAATWDAIASALANLTLNNAGFTTTFNQTSGVQWTWANTTIATGVTTNASPVLALNANYWTGTVSAVDSWTIQSSLAAGTNGASKLTVSHSGSTGATTVALPNTNTLAVGTASSVTGAISLAASGSATVVTATGNGSGWAFTGGGAVTLSCTGGLNMSGSGGATLSLANGSTWTTGAGGTINISPTSNLSTLLVINTTAATVSQSQSTAQTLRGKYWTGAASANDDWTIQNTVANGTNGASTLSIGHSGTSGLATIALNAHVSSSNTDMRGSVSSASGTTVSVTYGTAYASTPIVVVTPTTNAGTFFISASNTTGFTITYATAGAQTFDYIVIG